MPTYAIAHLRTPTVNEDVLRYLAEIDETLDPFEGRFVIHGGGEIDVIEGEWPGAIVVIEFPDRERAKAWYASPAYQAILRLRTDHIEGDAILADGVPEGYRAADKIAELR